MKKVIIVDDEKNIRERLAKFFPWDQYGFRVAGTAKNGIEGLKLIEQEQPHLVFSDIKMPIMNGLELAEKLSSTFPGIDLVFLTAYRDFDWARQAIVLQAKGYLIKPILKEDFTELMDRITQFNTLQGQSEDLVMTKHSTNDYVQFAVNYVNKHYMDNIMVSDITEQLFIHDAYFSKLFNEEMGMGFSTYVNHIRIEIAKRLIVNTNHQLRYISSEVGFSSHSYFNRVFKQQVGLSPLEYKKQYFNE